MGFVGDSGSDLGSAAGFSNACQVTYALTKRGEQVSVHGEYEMPVKAKVVEPHAKKGKGVARGLVLTGANPQRPLGAEESLSRARKGTSNCNVSRSADLSNPSKSRWA